MQNICTYQHAVLHAVLHLMLRFLLDLACWDDASSEKFALLKHSSWWEALLKTL